MKTIRKFSLILIAVAALFQSCDTENPQPVSKPADVYVGGYSDVGSNYLAATIWKNGIKQVLSDGITMSYAGSITISNEDVYVAGYEGNKAVYWKNGTKVELTDGTYESRAKGIMVVDNDVYVAVQQYGGGLNNMDVIKYFVNGEEFTCTAGGAASLTDTGKGMFVSGGNVYIVGYVTEGGVFRAALWTNGAITKLSTDRSFAKGITVVDGNVYVAGAIEKSLNTFSYQAGYWKNGTFTKVSTDESAASGILVDKGNVYLIGYLEIPEHSKAVYWKNGKMVQLTDGTVSGYAYKMEIRGGSLYVSGERFNNGYISFLMKDGVEIDPFGESATNDYGYILATN